MLSAPAAALLVVVFAAAATKEPIDGAFGLQFSEPMTDRLLAASVAEPPYPLPPGNLDQTLPEPVPGEHGGWYLFVPQARPELLNHPDVRFLLLRSHAGAPLRILAEHPQPDCVADMLWLTRSLARKYGAEDDPFGPQRPGFRQSARFVSERGQVDVSCGPTLLIEYTDTQAYGSWLAASAERHVAYLAEQARLEEERARLEHQRRRQLAEQFTAGDRFRLEGALGITFGEAVDPALLPDPEFVVDEPARIRLPGLPAAVRDGRITVTLGPDRLPVRIAGEFDDPDASRFAALAAALEAKYGPPQKDTPHHRIHKISGDYLVARYDPAQALARLVFIDDEARDAQKQRELAAQRARLAEQQRLFEEETAGL